MLTNMQAKLKVWNIEWHFEDVLKSFMPGIVWPQNLDRSPGAASIADLNTEERAYTRELASAATAGSIHQDDLRSALNAQNRAHISRSIQFEAVNYDDLVSVQTRSYLRTII